MPIALDSHVSQADIIAFAEARVNLPHAHVVTYREQVGRLRDRLETHIAAHPNFDLVKMRYAGSVQKGTALRTVNDLDVAVYIRAAHVPSGEPELINWVAERLREAYPTLSEDQFIRHHHCVTLSFRRSGLDVDVVPVLFEDEANDYGYLITKDSGARVRTSVTRHLEFIRRRKTRHPTHFRQLVRLAKWWARQRKIADPTFRFKSFMIELIVAKLVDDGVDPAQYAAALTKFFAYLAQDELRSTIAFSDYPESITSGELVGGLSPVRIYDPVNGENNVAARYTERERLSIVESAREAVDAITFARFATTKEEALAQWRRVFGPSFTA